MPFDYQPTLSGNLVRMRPLSAEDYYGLYAVASDPLVWEQHPVKSRYQGRDCRRNSSKAALAADALFSASSRAGVRRLTLTPAAR